MDNDQKDILDFLNSKNKDRSNLGNIEILLLFSKTIKNSLYITYNDLKDLNSCFICRDLMVHIFWILTQYTSSTKLILFMIDRSILLFNEYLKVSKQYGIDSINITEVKTFIINKTIGPLKKFKIKENNYNKLNNISNILNNFITDYFERNYKLDDFQYNMDNIINITTNISYKLYENNNCEILLSMYDHILNSEEKDIVYNVNKFKLLGELLLISGHEYENLEYLSNFIDNCELDIMDNFYDTNIDFQNNENFIYLKKMI